MNDLKFTCSQLLNYASFAALVLLTITISMLRLDGAISVPGDWPTYGGDPGGRRYSKLSQINRTNVSTLKLAWTYRTGELGQDSTVTSKLTFEATPILFRETLYLSTAFGKVIALDAMTGRERWTFDPNIERRRNYSEVTSRGVALWQDPRAAPPSARIFIGTIDARLIALDAVSGELCRDFGVKGVVELDANAPPVKGSGNYQVTSPPTVVGELVIVGSSIGDNWLADTGNGVVRAFDVRSGKLRWSWDPIPRRPGKVGAANAWSVMSADVERDLVFIPTGSPSPDFYGGLRAGDNRHANSVVALRASTGAFVWGFQTVHHDLWDYDVAAQPVLSTLTRDGVAIPAVVQPTKMGFLFVLHRETGEPLFPIEERPVPQSDIPGERTSPTQPFPIKPPSLMPLTPLSPDDAWGLNEDERRATRELLERHPASALFTPPSLRGVVTSPGNASGVNWGSAAFDPQRGLVVANTSRLGTLVQLLSREDYARWRALPPEERGDWEAGEQVGAAFAVRRKTLLTPSRLPGQKPPWGTLAAVDLNAGAIRWEIPFGEAPEWHPTGAALKKLGLRGTPNAGGPIVTAGGLIFIGATFDNRFRAYDVESGTELWRAELPRSAIATPMTYRAANGRQHVVICAGGHGKAGAPIGDFVMAFTLP